MPVVRSSKLMVMVLAEELTEQLSVVPSSSSSSPAGTSGSGLLLSMFNSEGKGANESSWDTFSDC